VTKTFLRTLIVLLPVVALGAPPENVVCVRDRDSLIDALENAKPGTKVLVAPGEYRG